MAEDASKFVLLASPNWYCSSVADCSLTKIYAFGARNCVYLLDVSSDKPVFHGQLVGHTERVSSVCFSKHKLHANFVASGSDDKTVKMWDTETKLKLLEHKAHNVRTVVFSNYMFIFIYLFSLWVYLGFRTCELFLCFVPFVFLGFIVLTSLFSLFYVTGEFNRFLHRG